MWWNTSLQLHNMEIEVTLIYTAVLMYLFRFMYTGLSQKIRIL